MSPLAILRARCISGQKPRSNRLVSRKGTALDMAATSATWVRRWASCPSTAADMSTSLTGLAGDLASFKNIGIDQAMTALKGVYTGEGEALKTLGIVMQDNTLIAYAQAKGYEKQYKEMTQAEKVALRYAYVMDATKNAQGDFARTSDGVANQTRIVTESLNRRRRPWEPFYCLKSPKFYKASMV